MGMKRFFYTGTREEHLNILVLVLRICIAAFMITHGWPKFLKLLEGGEIQFGDPIGLGPAFSLVLVAILPNQHLDLSVVLYTERENHLVCPV